MQFKKIIFITFISFTIPYSVFADFAFRKSADLNINIANTEAEVVQTALEMFGRDYKAVFDGDISKIGESQIFIGTLGNSSQAEKSIDAKLVQNLKLHQEGYILLVKNDKIYILGSDKRGTAYGILELSRRIGVSPWEWWADSHIKKQNTLPLKNGLSLLEFPSVAHRGIFINDEDWGINPWAYLTNEPSKTKGEIGPKTNARIFELLLRLRANTYWPAMHAVSEAFYLTPGNKEIADKYGIVMGSSHCEPMMRNANSEWKIEGTGEYDYVHNKASVLKFWEERVKQLTKSDNIYTLGIRGVHDGKMQGANTLQEQKTAITSIIKDQREMIGTYLNSNVEKVPQVFIPYKEVLDVYNMGLQVPDDVTLMWTDDNYGYIRHMPNAKESQRKGGNGVYYHISYWGRPHDYLWLATNHPAQIYTQMKLAYDKGAKDMWILNVGDIKPGEYLTELFLDMAWNINAIQNSKEGLDNHLSQWLGREFGKKNEQELLAVMNEYYRLAYIRKPEFMGNTRTEEQDPKFKEVSDLPWNVQEIKKRISDYDAIANKVMQLSKKIAPEKQDAWFELIEYPVRGAAELNKKQLYGQLARHGLAKWEQSDAAYNVIEVLTQKYNSLAGGKWKNMMDSKPRSQAVFQKLPQIKSKNALPNIELPIAFANGTEYAKFSGKKPVSHGLGYERGAVSLLKGDMVSYEFKSLGTDSVWIEVALAPNHPVEGKQIRYELVVDGKPLKVVDFHTVDRNEEWKQNVLTNHAVRTTKFKFLKPKDGTINTVGIKALDEGVILDQVKIWRQEPVK
ncbi:glycosyl hydrolase 115 family protein [Pedobacter mucosus]|uniref:glycosyl hydrolase 115 family protein n=1 Tax=Pedobacter mucosus TaxID=2895286 RepID=UPI001EE41AE5|nr:glycosyl hydrolase 115 family protein [Pedobacter mucosus]UKT64233.1 glycosyl hydrolase 115 family protein [Pedobacter mucosus]